MQIAWTPDLDEKLLNAPTELEPLIEIMDKLSSAGDYPVFYETQREQVEIIQTIDKLLVRYFRLLLRSNTHVLIRSYKDLEIYTTEFKRLCSDVLGQMSLERAEETLSNILLKDKASQFLLSLQQQTIKVIFDEARTETQALEESLQDSETAGMLEEIMPECEGGKRKVEEAGYGDNDDDFKGDEKAIFEIALLDDILDRIHQLFCEQYSS